MRPMNGVTSKGSGSGDDAPKLGRHERVFVLRQGFKAELGNGDAQGLGQPFGDHGAVAPFAVAGDHRGLRRRAFVAEHDRDEASGQFGQMVGDGAGIERAENFGPVKVVVLLDPDAVEPGAGGERSCRRGNRPACAAACRGRCRSACDRRAVW